MTAQRSKTEVELEIWDTMMKLPALSPQAAKRLLPRLNALFVEAKDSPERVARLK